jgi:hypothetical protein
MRGGERRRGRRSGRRRERLADSGRQIKVTGDDEVRHRGDSDAAKVRRLGEVKTRAVWALRGRWSQMD